MRILLDTNILIHREASTFVNSDIGRLFYWLDKIHAEKCIHPLSVSEIQGHKDDRVVKSFAIKLSSYVELKTLAPESHEIQKLRADDHDQNSEIDTSIINEVFAKRVDGMITEDRGIHRKAKSLGVEHLVFTIDGYLEKVTAENPELVDYKVLPLRRSYFGKINLETPFFDSFRRDYQGFDDWFNRKADEVAYICNSDGEEMQAFLYLKLEDENESYSDISPVFSPKRRLKIGTFKVTLNGYKLGERFLKIIFDNAITQRVSEIYVTIFDRDADQLRLVELLQDWGFVRYGVKETAMGKELVLVRNFSPVADIEHPALTFPYMSRFTRKFVAAIRPQYHTELLPDSILRNEDPDNFDELRPNRNALRKVFVSRSVTRDLISGDLVIFYRTKTVHGPAFHTSVATTLGIIENVFTNIPDLETFIKLCRKRSVFSDSDLEKIWNYNPNSRPFVVNFLHSHSLPKRPNLKALRESKVISEAPRGFDEISDQSFNTLLQISNANQSLIVDQT